MVVKAVESVLESAVESVVLVSIVEAVDCRLRLRVTVRPRTGISHSE